MDLLMKYSSVFVSITPARLNVATLSPHIKQNGVVVLTTPIETEPKGIDKFAFCSHCRAVPVHNKQYQIVIMLAMLSISYTPIANKL